MCSNLECSANSQKWRNRRLCYSIDSIDSIENGEKIVRAKMNTEKYPDVTANWKQTVGNELKDDFSNDKMKADRTF